MEHQRSVTLCTTEEAKTLYDAFRQAERIAEGEARNRRRVTRIEIRNTTPIMLTVESIDYQRKEK